MARHLRSLGATLLLAAVAIAELTWKPRQHSVLNSYLVVEDGGDNALVLSQTSLTRQVVGDLSGRLNLDITHNSDVPAGVANTDRTLSVALVYQF